MPPWVSSSKYRGSQSLLILSVFVASLILNTILRSLLSSWLGLTSTLGGCYKGVVLQKRGHVAWVETSILCDFCNCLKYTDLHHQKSLFSSLENMSLNILVSQNASEI